MGLDSIWQVPAGVEYPQLPNLSICGGMMSGPNHEKGICTSFRGKVYSEFMKAITGFSLYEDSISGDELLDIVNSLTKLKTTLNSLTPGYAMLECIDKLFSIEEAYERDRIVIGLETLDDLIRMFEVYSEIEGATLVPWY